MHSRIFQISTEPIDKENYLNEDTLQQGDGSFYDYCSEIDEEDRKEDIANLVNHALPKVENPLKVVPLIHSNLTPVKFSHSPFCLFLFSSYSSCPLCRVLH